MLFTKLLLRLAITVVRHPLSLAFGLSWAVVTVRSGFPRLASQRAGSERLAR